MLKFAKFVISSMLASLLLCSFVAQAEDEIKIGIMQDQSGDAQKYKPLMKYLESKGIETQLVSAPSYSRAAKMFSSGQIDAMFSGSGVAGTMIIKGLAKPVVRPVSGDGNSTYWAVIVAAKGAPKFNGNAGYFQGKRVIYTALASSGEIYYHSLPGSKSNVNTTILRAPSHGAALRSLNLGKADVAIVKNRVWDKERAEYGDLVKVGEDTGENPDNSLIVSAKMDDKMAKKLADTLLEMNADNSELARQAFGSLGVKSFIRTTAKDFEHNLSMLKRAGIDESFDFTFN